MAPSPRKIKPLLIDDWEALVVGVQAATAQPPEPGEDLQIGRWGRKHKEAAVSRLLGAAIAADLTDLPGGVHGQVAPRHY